MDAACNNNNYLLNPMSENRMCILGKRLLILDRKRKEQHLPTGREHKILLERLDFSRVDGVSAEPLCLSAATTQVRRGTAGRLGSADLFERVH